MLEDDSDDRYLTKEVVDSFGVAIQIHFFFQSEDLLPALEAVKPNLILVDYNSTPENGVQVLKKLKADSKLRKIPVVILSDSNLEQYRTECYVEGASGFVLKPTTQQTTISKINSFFTYWTEVAES